MALKTTLHWASQDHGGFGNGDEDFNDIDDGNDDQFNGW